MKCPLCDSEFKPAEFINITLTECGPDTHIAGHCPSGCGQAFDIYVHESEWSELDPASK